MVKVSSDISSRWMVSSPDQTGALETRSAMMGNGSTVQFATRELGRPRELYRRSSEICTALSAAPFRRLSPTEKNSSARSSKRSLRMRPTKQGS
jgi:hypothetical protein